MTLAEVVRLKHRLGAERADCHNSIFVVSSQCRHCGGATRYPRAQPHTCAILAGRAMVCAFVCGRACGLALITHAPRLNAVPGPELRTRRRRPTQAVGLD